MHPSDIVLGTDGTKHSPVSLSLADRMFHTYVVGGSGSGKSKLLESMIRQDIANWRTARHGLLMIDPHGSLYDNIMSWLADANARLPIVPIDFRRDDVICGYDLLRQREGFQPSVVVNQIVDTIAYVWGASGIQQTPLFGRWMNLILSTLYHLDLRFVDALRLIADAGFRKAAIAWITDDHLRRMWQLSAHLKPDDFFEQVNSSLNRLPAFLQNENLRMSFAQKESFDFRKAIDAGWIVLVCLGEDGGQISQNDARTLGTLLLSDLWSAAKQRGKPASAELIKPFFVYLDEFQTTITPTIAENLEQARGYGLWMTLAHQAPNQLKRLGEVGEGIFRSILTNTGTKVVFRSGDPQDLDDLAQSLFLGAIDFEKEKYRIESTKVLDHEWKQIESTTTGTSSATSTSTSEGRNERPDREYESSREVSGWTEDQSDAESNSSSESTTTTETLVPIIGTELSNIVMESVEEQLWRAKTMLFGQPNRTAFFKRLGQHAPVSLTCRTVRMPTLRPSTVDLYCEILRAEWPFFVSRDAAAQTLRQHESGEAPVLDSSGRTATNPQGKSVASADDEPQQVWRRVR